MRAGPWHAPLAGGVTTLHAYVDHSIVSLIVDNRTALTAWVHAQFSESVRPPPHSNNSESTTA